MKLGHLLKACRTEEELRELADVFSWAAAGLLYSVRNRRDQMDLIAPDLLVLGLVSE
jgi:hypothetical protein